MWSIGILFVERSHSRIGSLVHWFREGKTKPTRPKAIQFRQAEVGDTTGSAINMNDIYLETVSLEALPLLAAGWHHVDTSQPSLLLAARSESNNYLMSFAAFAQR